MAENSRYTTTARTIEVEGERVGFVSCKQCGVSLLIDPKMEFDALAVHDDYHEWLVSK